MTVILGLIILISPSVLGIFLIIFVIKALNKNNRIDSSVSKWFVLMGFILYMITFYILIGMVEISQNLSFQVFFILLLSLLFSLAIHSKTHNKLLAYTISSILGFIIPYIIYINIISALLLIGSTL